MRDIMEAMEAFPQTATEWIEGRRKRFPYTKIIKTQTDGTGKPIKSLPEEL